jgi:hypothetical protein
MRDVGRFIRTTTNEEGIPANPPHYIQRIPVTWYRAMSGLPRRAIIVGGYLWLLAGLRKTPERLAVSYAVLERDWNLHPRAAARGINDLTGAGLIKFIRRGGHGPRVTLVTQDLARRNGHE